jgi:hypothetical protein
MEDVFLNSEDDFFPSREKCLGLKTVDKALW